MSARDLRSEEVFWDIRHFTQIGCCKPDETNYKTAVDGLGLPPEKLLFVDDNLENVEKPIDLGLNCILMVRRATPASDDIEWVRNLEEIEALL